MELFPFQSCASTQITERFIEYWSNPLMKDRTTAIPFYQNLSGITGSGKTLILADAIEQMRFHLPIEPIVLWLSKGKVVVWQTYTNLSTGKYAGLLGGYEVKPLLDCTQDDIEGTEKGLVLVATIAKFNQKDKEKGDRKVFRVGLDNAEKSLWDRIKIRKNIDGKKRNLIIVYDEGHNLSDQQTSMLLELGPDALIAASATVRVPESLERIWNRLREDKGWAESDFVTQIRSSDVVNEALVKKYIMLGGYMSPMEVAVNDMLSDMEKVKEQVKPSGLTFKPKAVYVCNTNVIPGTVEKDNIRQPFTERGSQHFSGHSLSDTGQS